MDNFKIIYKILKIMEAAMDLEEFDKSTISYEALSLTEPRWCRIIAMLVSEGYVTGIEVWNSNTCKYPRVALSRPEITMKGLEYLEQNSLMKRAADMAKGIKEIVPGI